MTMGMSSHWLPYFASAVSRAVVRHHLVLNIVRPVLLPSDDDGDVLALAAILCKCGFQGGPLLASLQIAKDGLVHHLEVLDLQVGLGHHGGDRPLANLLEALDKEVGADHGGALSLVKSLR